MIRTHTLAPIAAMTLAGVIAFATPATAQTYNNGNAGVADVSVVNGSVVIMRADSGAQVAASVNAPLVAGDVIATGSGSSAEVQFDGISMLRLSSNTQVRFVNLSPNSREVQLGVGTVDLAELQGADGTQQIDTPPLALRPNQTGDYRVTVQSNGETLVTVRSGAATIATANGTQTLAPGSTLVAYGSSISMQGPIGFDSFDQFNTWRDQAAVSAYNANPYLSPQLAGYSNLANSGQWQNVPGYGYAWAPNNQSQTNFAPYQNGQWVWEPGSGYTWVDNAPTGYTTSHYGTWFNNPNYGGWLWQPPSSQTQSSSTNLASSWLPAVVSFFLTGNNGGSSGGLENLLTGNNSGSAGGLGNVLGSLSGVLGNSGTANASNTDIGWIPLAPGEQYQPWSGQNYSYPPTTITGVSNISNLYSNYSNAQYYGGTTMVPISAWRNGNFKHLVAIRPQQLKQIVLIRGAVPIVPTTANLHYTTIIIVKHPIVLSSAFAAPRFAAKAPIVTRFSFRTQQAQIQSIASERPKVAPLSPHPVRAAHAAYYPVVHVPIQLMVMKPVKHAPVLVQRPVHTAAPVVKPVKHAPVLVQRPVHTPAPVVRPANHPPVRVVRPVHTPAPVVKSVKHQAHKPTAHPSPKPSPTPG
jgi:FecR protein